MSGNTYTLPNAPSTVAGCTPVANLDLTPNYQGLNGTQNIGGAQQFNLKMQGKNTQQLSSLTFTNDGGLNSTTGNAQQQTATNLLAPMPSGQTFYNEQQRDNSQLCQNPAIQACGAGGPRNPNTAQPFENELTHLGGFFGNNPYGEKIHDTTLPPWHFDSASGYYETNLQAACPSVVYANDFEHLQSGDRAGWAPCQIKDDKLQSLYGRRASCTRQYVSTHNKVLDRALSTTDRRYNGNPAHTSCGMFDTEALINGDGEFVNAIAGKLKKSDTDRRQRIAVCRGSDEHCECPGSSHTEGQNWGNTWQGATGDVSSFEVPQSGALGADIAAGAGMMHS